MLPSLKQAGLLGYDDTIHAYHCDCGFCDLSNEWPLRAQRDSSCDGEIISKPFRTLEEGVAAMVGLQQAAVDADAVPGYNAGFHVHVEPSDLHTDPDAQARYEFFWQWLRWEPVMHQLATGAFQTVRSFNPTCRARVAPCFQSSRRTRNFEWHNEYADFESDGARVGRWQSDCEATLDTSELLQLKQDIYQYMYASDRHTALALRTRFETYEFRLWNSTRSAWRMEMFAILSNLWVDPNVVRAIAGTTIPNRIADRPVRFAETLAGLGHARAAELVLRQTSYVRSRQGQGDPVLLAA